MKRYVKKATRKSGLKNNALKSKLLTHGATNNNLIKRATTMTKEQEQKYQVESAERKPIAAYMHSQSSMVCSLKMKVFQLSLIGLRRQNYKIVRTPRCLIPRVILRMRNIAKQRLLEKRSGSILIHMIGVGITSAALFAF